jgi:hypothetical protein
VAASEAALSAYLRALAEGIAASVSAADSGQLRV